MRMKKEVSYGFEDETLESKARWFQSLPIYERMEMLCMFTDMILENNPEIVEKRDVKGAHILSFPKTPFENENIEHRTRNTEYRS